jgi:hypothetical protein
MKRPDELWNCPYPVRRVQAIRESLGDFPFDELAELGVSNRLTVGFIGAEVQLGSYPDLTHSRRSSRTFGGPSRARISVLRATTAVRSDLRVR